GCRRWQPSARASRPPARAAPPMQPAGLISRISECPRSACWSAAWPACAKSSRSNAGWAVCVGRLTTVRKNANIRETGRLLTELIYYQEEDGAVPLVEWLNELP